jgi:hypothetical protein
LSTGPAIGERAEPRHARVAPDKFGQLGGLEAKKPIGGHRPQLFSGCTVPRKRGQSPSHRLFLVSCSVGQELPESIHRGTIADDEDLQNIAPEHPNDAAGARLRKFSERRGNEVGCEGPRTSEQNCEGFTSESDFLFQATQPCPMVKCARSPRSGRDRRREHEVLEGDLRENVPHVQSRRAVDFDVVHGRAYPADVNSQ